MKAVLINIDQESTIRKEQMFPVVSNISNIHCNWLLGLMLDATKKGVELFSLPRNEYQI